jgi:hypothetical protein
MGLRPKDLGIIDRVKHELLLQRGYKFGAIIQEDAASVAIYYPEADSDPSENRLWSGSGATPREAFAKAVEWLELEKGEVE